MYEANENLEVLDFKNKEGDEEFDSSEDDYGDEEGEFDMMGSEQREIIENLDPETKEKYLNGDMSLEEMKALGLIGGMDDYGEEGELEMDEEGEAEEDDDENKK